MMIHDIHFQDAKNDDHVKMVTITFPLQFINFYASLIYIAFFKVKKQARKLQATLDGCNPKLSPTYLLTDGGEV